MSRSSSPRPETGARRLWVTILAGGAGTRFWPVSTPERPKQLLPLAGEEALVVQTVERARALAPAERIRILASQALVPPLGAVLPSLDHDAYMVEPRPRGTAPVLAWAAWYLGRQDPEGVLVSLHSDHHIHPASTFVDVVRAAAHIAAREEVLVTVGATPDRPETGYGYIRPGAALAEAEGVTAHRVESFHEKPDPDTAAGYVAGGYLWNTGIFVWTPEVFLREVRACAPELAAALPLLEAGDVEGFFREAPEGPVDVAVLERSSRVAVVPATFAWDDVGAWQALYRNREADGDGNVVVGDGHVVDGTGNIAYAEEGTVVLFGVSDLVVVKTADVTLVVPRDRSSHLKELLEKLPESLWRARS